MDQKDDDRRQRTRTLPTNLNGVFEQRSTSLTDMFRNSLGRTLNDFHQHNCSGKKKLKIFGVPLSDLPLHPGTNVPEVVHCLVDFLTRHGI